MWFMSTDPFIWEYIIQELSHVCRIVTGCFILLEEGVIHCHNSGIKNVCNTRYDSPLTADSSKKERTNKA